ncbi:TMC [Mytilus edulis]|uniref:TMC n=1 Tax=Mytilus edulis TaxID=6550 RepID=A0A8S3UPL5_MYTED|nr:TMC [Mytilus edulis]
MASIVNNSDENGIDVCTPLIGENPENDPFQFLEEEKQPDTMEPHDSYLGYDKEPNIGGYNNGHHRIRNQCHNTSIMGYDHVPDASSSQPQTLVVRNRKKSIKLEQIFDKLDQLDQLDGDDDQYFQRTRSKRRERSKTLKERKIERNASQKDSSLKTTKTLGERYAEMKNNEDVTARNLATLMRDSTLRKMNKLRHSKGSKTWKNVKRSYNEFSHRISLWYSTFKEIEGEYGTAVMTYFKFLKWLLRLNFYTMIITFCVITIPFLVLGPSSYEDSVRSVNNSQDSIDCTKEYIHYMDNFTSQESLDEKVIDFLQGTGWMERTILFYGVYYNKTYYSEIEKTEKIYNMSLAYLLAVGCSFIICFILIVKNASKSAKVSLGLESSVAMYTNKVFAAWDYCINNQKNAKVKSVGIKFEITADLKEQKRTIDWEGKEFSDRCAIYFRRVVINLIVIILLGGSLALIAYTAIKMIELQKKEFEEIVILIIQYVPYLTITILNLAVPILFQKLVQFEMYKYETELKLTLARSVLLRLSSPIVLLAILYQQLIVTSKDSTSGKCGNVRWSATGSGLRGDVKNVLESILFFGNVPCHLEENCFDGVTPLETQQTDTVSDEINTDSSPESTLPITLAESVHQHRSSVSNGGTDRNIAQCFEGLQETFKQLIYRDNCTHDTGRDREFNLQQWYNHAGIGNRSEISNRGNNTVLHGNTQEHASFISGPQVGNVSCGVRSDEYSNVDIISPSIQKQIIDGKDVNLASLLIPNYETPQIHSVAANGLELNISGKPDPRLNRKLTIQEFIKAFGKFKRVMSSVYPDRRAELDAYEDEIIDISNFYGDRFYDYHKLFSAKSAALLRERRIKVDWSKRDRDLLSLIVAGGNVNVCKICNLVDHTTAFCPMQTSMTYQDYPDKVSRQVDTTDKLGRKKIYHSGREVCNNFNTKLISHPDKKFVNYLCNGLEKGFDTMVSTTDLPTKECRNSLSARTQPDVVSDLIEKEVFKGFLYGPFKDPPFQNYRVSPIGIAEGKYSGKKRLILDLSSPHNDDKHLKNNYKVNSILHLLDDFLTIDPPDADGERTMAIMMMIFKKLNIPIAKHKTIGPVKCLEYLGIILDSEKMEARLPLNKVDRICEFIKKLCRKKSCTKRELLQLLGHLNFASRVILPGRSFVSYLIGLSTTVNDLHHYVKLDKECRVDLEFWLLFLSSWNGVNMFYSRQFYSSYDMELFTDASSTKGFGGYFKGEWFYSSWPSNIAYPDKTFSMAFLELYPIVVSAILWGSQWTTKRILFWCDNEATVAIVKKGRSKLGMMFSPLIPFMTFLKILIFFYSKKFLLKYCEAQERPYRTSRSNSLFMLVLLLSFVFAAAPFAVSYTVASWPGVLRGIFSFLGTVGFFVPVIIALCLLMYYYWLLGQGYKKTEKILQHQLKLEGQDKRYLMDRVTEFLESTEVNQNTLHNAAL